MILSILVVVDLDGGIGKDGAVPWHLSADLQLFKRITMGHHVLMGRKTFDSIGKALPGRTNLVLSRKKGWSPPGVNVFSNLTDAVRNAETQGENELFIIGGGEIFAQSIGLAHRIYLTRVETNANCMVFFPHIDPSMWKIIEIGHHPADEKNDHAFTLFLLESKFHELP